jgi:uncharacterized protein YneF (UPF0154 family)
MALSSWKPKHPDAGPATADLSAAQVVKAVVKIYKNGNSLAEIGEMFHPRITTAKIREMVVQAGVLRKRGQHLPSYEIQDDNGSWRTVSIKERDAFIIESAKVLRLAEVGLRVRPPITKQAVSIILIKNNVARRPPGVEGRPFDLIKSDSPFLSALRQAVVGSGMVRRQVYDACERHLVPKHVVYKIMCEQHSDDSKSIAHRIATIAASAAVNDLPMEIVKKDHPDKAMTAADIGMALAAGGIRRLEEAGLTHATAQRMANVAPPVADAINVFLAIAKAVGSKVVAA